MPRLFAEEARTLDAARMQALEPRKRATLVVALLATQAAQALDDLGEMFVRRMEHIHTTARTALERYRAATVERTDGLVTTLHDLLLAHQEEGTVDQRFAAMDALIAPRRDELLEACEAHLTHAASNYSPVRLARVQEPPRHRLRPAGGLAPALDQPGHDLRGSAAFCAGAGRTHRGVAAHDTNRTDGTRPDRAGALAQPQLGPGSLVAATD
jgi:hypothetical protein